MNASGEGTGYVYRTNLSYECMLQYSIMCTIFISSYYINIIHQEVLKSMPRGDDFIFKLKSSKSQWSALHSLR